MGHLENMLSAEWDSVALTRTPLGLTAQERFERFRFEALSELALRLVGGVIVALSTILWLILPADTGSGQFLSHGLLAAVATATGLAVYAYGTRGFRRQISLDARRGTLALTKININNQSRVARRIDVREIESIFLRRPAAPGLQASLCIRPAGGRHTPILALTGDKAELEKIHLHLCDMVHKGTQAPSVRVSAAKPRVKTALHQVRA